MKTHLNYILAIALISASLFFFFEIQEKNKRIENFKDELSDLENKVVNLKEEKRNLKKGLESSNSKTEFAKRTECKKLCKPIYKEDVESFGENSTMSPEYSYNSDKDACYYHSGHLMDDGELWEEIINCQTNETLLIHSTAENETLDTCEKCVKSMDKFERKAKALMGN